MLIVSKAAQSLQIAWRKQISFNPFLPTLPKFYIYISSSLICSIFNHPDTSSSIDKTDTNTLHCALLSPHKRREVMIPDLE